MLIVRAIRITKVIAVKEVIIIILDMAMFKEEDGSDFFTLKIFLNFYLSCFKSVLKIFGILPKTLLPLVKSSVSIN